MAVTHKGSRVTTFTVIVFSLSSISQIIGVGIGVWWSLWSVLIILFYTKRELFGVKEQEKYVWTVWAFLGWNIFSIIRGIFIADNYWEFKALINNSLIMLIPLSILITQGKYFGQLFFKSYLKFGVPIFFILYFFMSTDMVGFYLAPFSVIILFFRVLSSKWKITLFLITGFIFFVDLEARSNVIKFLVPFIIIVFFSFSMFNKRYILNSVRLIFLFLPLVLMFLYFSTGFNLFDFQKYIDNEFQIEKVNGKVDLLADTRTGLYQEVVNSAIITNSIWQGRSPAKGYKSKHFGIEISKITKTNANERYSSEVSILNIFTWTGIIGVLLYFLVFYSATYLAINASNNIYSKIIGIYISFRWVYGWIEDFTRFDLFQICLWLLIGMCFSKDFRKLTDAQFELWIRSIFSKRLIILN